jgi:hypothetical protein
MSNQAHVWLPKRAVVAQPLLKLGYKFGSRPRSDCTSTRDAAKKVLVGLFNVKEVQIQASTIFPGSQVAVASTWRTVSEHDIEIALAVDIRRRFLP